MSIIKSYAYAQKDNRGSFWSVYLVGRPAEQVYESLEYPQRYNLTMEQATYLAEVINEIVANLSEQSS